jgi:hypothetical protein
MFCDRCGTQLHGAEGFCPKCGKQVGTIPLMPVQSRLAGHVRLLGILWLAISVFSLLPGIVLLTIFGHHSYFFGGFGPPLFVRGLIQFVGLLFLGGAVLGIITGWGLLERQPWARMLAIVLGVFRLLEPPFGTALGIYTLWVLLPSGSEEEYRRMARAA